MGEVWRARDTKLRRDVAIKVLPDAVAREPEHLSRFRRDARALAALNHPNISAIYGLEEHDQIHFLVLELVEGDTLSDLLAGGPFPITESLRIGAQIAEALGAAHDKGIVHRDLKPANIKVTPDGQVKVLDFGLAKAFSGEGDADLSWALTITETVESRKGRLVGTPAYMSPEQAQGQQIDKRTDTWAFGCVLFEMLVGKRPFAGITLSDTIARVLERDPDWDALPKGTPARMRDLLERCLEKDARNRQRDFGDVRIEIERALSETVIPSHEVSSASGLPLNRVISAVVVVGLISVATGLIIWNSGSPGLETVSGPPRLENIERLTSLPGNESQPAWSPDAQFVAFTSGTSGNRDIWIKAVSGGEPIQLTHHEADDYTPDWSPDGKQIVFRSNRTNGGLYTIDAFGGDARRIADFGYRPRWSPDGRQVVFQLRGGTLIPNEIYVLDYPPDEPPQKLLAWEDGQDPYTNADWSPDGEYLVYRTGQYVAGPGVAIAAVENPSDQFFLEVDGEKLRFAQPVWARDGRGIIGVRSSGRTGGALWYAGLDQNRRATSISRLTTGVGDGNPDVTRDGKRLAYTTAAGHFDIWKVELDLRSGQPAGDPKPLIGSPSNDEFPAILPDDRHVLFISDRANERHLYVSDPEGGDVRLVDNSRDWGRIPSVSPDGRWVALQVGPPTETYLIPFDPVTQQALGSPRSVGVQAASNWSPDGKYLLFTGSDVLGSGGIDVLDLSGSEAKKVFWPFSAGFLEKYPRKIIGYFSRDGNWIAFGAYKERDKPAIFVVRPGSTEPHLIWEGAANPMWGPTMEKIYMWSERPDETQGRLGFVVFDTETGAPTSDFQPLNLEQSARSGYSAASISSDGKWLVYFSETVEGDIYVADLVPSS